MQASDTAYPRLKTNFNDGELDRWYMPTPEEHALSGSTEDPQKMANLEKKYSMSLREYRPLPGIICFSLAAITLKIQLMRVWKDLAKKQQKFT